MARLLLRDLTPGTDYSIQLRAVGEDTVSEWSPLFTLSVTSDGLPPDAPAWAASNPWVAVGDTFVATWQQPNLTLDQNKDFSHYQITFTADAQSYTVNTTNTNYVLSFEENRARFGTPQPTVLAKVRSVDQTGNVSAYSAELSATNAIPNAPTSVDVEPISDGLRISWVNSTSDDVVGYNIYIGTAPNPTTKVAFTNSNPYTYTSLTFVTQYVRIKAVDKFGQESAYSNEDSGTPESPFVFDTTAPAAPGSFNVTVSNEDVSTAITRQVAVATWTHAGASDLAGFHFRFKRTTDSTWTIYDIEPDARSFKVTLPQPFVAYNFEIRAYDFYTNRSAWVAYGPPAVTTYTPPTFLTALVIGSGGYIESSSFGTGVGFHIDDDGITIYDGLISGQAITTGVIRSNEPALDEDGNPIVGEYAWQIDLDGDAVLGDVKVRGNMVVGNAAGPTTSILQAGNYIPGETGWAIRSDGSSEFRQMVADSIDGTAIRADTLSVSKLAPGALSGEITLESGAIAAYGQLGERISFSGTGLQSDGAPLLQVTTIAVTTNVATVTTEQVHGFTAGNLVYLQGLGSPFDGFWTIASTPTTTTFTFAITTSDLASTTVSGSARSKSIETNVIKPVLVSFPTDGTNPNIISGMLTAETLNVTNTASFRGKAELEYGSVMTIASAILPPTGLPVISHDYNIVKVDDISTSTEFVGFTIGHDGNYYLLDNGRSKRVAVFASGGTAPGAFVSNFITNMPSGMRAIVYSATQSRYYILVAQATGALFQLQDVILTYDTSGVLQNTSAVLRTYSYSPGILSDPDEFSHLQTTLGWDYTTGKLLYCLWDDANTRLVVRTYDISSGNPVTPFSASVNLASSSGKNHPRFVAKGDFDYGVGTDRIVVKTLEVGNSWQVWNNAGAIQSGESWPSAQGRLVGGAWSTTESRFKSFDMSRSVKTYYGGTSYWNSGVGTHWIAYSWYDSVPTTHETQLSPIASYELPKRARMNVTITKVPNIAGNTDSPNKARIWVYAVRQNTKPGATGSNWKLRHTVGTNEVSAAIDPNGSLPSDTPQSTNGFDGLGGGPAQIISSTGNSYWKGDDTARFHALELRASSDVTISSGNTPPLRIGALDGKEMRLDGNEIQVVTSPTSGVASDLHLNVGGGSIQLGQNSRKIKGIDFGSESAVPNGSGNINVSHTLGVVPTTVIVAPVAQESVAASYRAFDLSTTGFKVRVKDAAGADYTGPNTRAFDWIAISV